MKLQCVSYSFIFFQKTLKISYKCMNNHKIIPIFVPTFMRVDHQTRYKIGNVEDFKETIKTIRLWDTLEDLSN